MTTTLQLESKPNPASQTNEHVAAGTGSHLWESVRQQLDVAQYRPQAAPGIVISRLSDRSGVYYVIKNPATKTYYRLSERDYFVWQRLDGSHTVKELVVAFFTQYGSFAFARVAGLVAGLKANGFLVDQPVSVYQQVRRQLQRRSPGHRIAALWHGFLQKQFAIHGMDRFMSALYRYGGWLLFTWPAQVFFLLVSLVGVTLYVRLFASGALSVMGAGSSVAAGLLWLLLLNLISILLHEMSHGLTVKHYGREVRRAGFMIYFGLPAFFVDTTDIWLEGRRARLAVTWAGPYSGLILAGLCGIVLTLWPALAISGLLYQFAFLALLTVFVNLNPLLELDGYYLLMDWLEIPMLRRKSLEFLRGGLWARLRTAGETRRRAPLAVLRGLSREERIFTVFGLLSALWTGYAVFIGVSFWQGRLAGSLSSLFQKQTDAPGLALALVGVLISLAFIVAVGTYPLLLARRGARWTAQRGAAASLWRVGAILVVAAVGLALLPRWLALDWLEPAIGVAALAAASWLTWRNSAAFARSRLGWSLRFLTLLALLVLAAETVGDLAQVVPGLPQETSTLILLLHAGAYLALLLCGLAMLAGVNLRRLSWGERTALLAGWLASYAVMAYLTGRDSSAAATLAALVPLLALTCLIPTISSFWRTEMGPGWAVLSLALAGLVAAAVAPVSPTLPWLLLAVACALHSLALHRLSARSNQPEAGTDLNDLALLRRAFDWTADSIVDQYRELAGRRETETMVETFNTHALAAGWPVRLRGQSTEDLPATETTLMETGQTLGAALALLLSLVGDEIGGKLAARSLQRAYDGLAWEEREVGGQYLFWHVPGADALRKAFDATRLDYTHLLRRMPLFSAMSQSQIDLLAGRLRKRQIRVGHTIVRQGDPGDEFYVIASGHVEISVQDKHGASEVVNRLGRGDYFGELALLHDAPRSATCRAVTPAELLVLSRQDFDRLVRRHFDLRDKLDESIRRSELLRKLPLFAELDGLQVQAVAAQTYERRYRAGEQIIRCGDEGDTFYVVESGRVQAYLGQNGATQVLRESGPGEYFGEIALLTDARRTASVRATEDTALLALNKEDFDRLVVRDLYASRALELESSRRMLHSRRSERVDG